MPILGRQTPLVALRSNPALFEVRDFNTPFFQYPLRAREFKPGRYAWIVTASVGRNTPLGESEVGYFEWKTTPLITKVLVRTLAISGISEAIREELRRRCLSPLGAVSQSPAVIMVETTGSGN